MSSFFSSMALALVLLVFVFIPLASSRGLSADEELLMLGRFHGWMSAHGRSYATEEEKLHRFEIYLSNMEFIEEANRDGRLGYELGETPFTDLTHEEFVTMYSNRVDLLPEETLDKEVITTLAGHVDEGNRSPPINITSLPQTVDWRAKGVVTPAKNQGTCGSCWAFSAVAVIESAYAISKGGSPPLLSEQEIVDCDKHDYGCKAGWHYGAFKWVVDNGGIAASADYSPYTAKVGTCQTSKLGHHAASIRSYKMVTANSEAALMEAVVAQPVAVAFDLGDRCFQNYIKGVYDGKCYKSGNVYTGPCGTALNHALAIVGYGTKPDGTKYWIAKNSWSANWGENGFIYLERDVPNNYGLCGLARRPSYPIV